MVAARYLFNGPVTPRAVSCRFADRFQAALLLRASLFGEVSYDLQSRFFGLSFTLEACSFGLLFLLPLSFLSFFSLPLSFLLFLFLLLGFLSFCDIDRICSLPAVHETLRSRSVQARVSCRSLCLLPAQTSDHRPPASGAFACAPRCRRRRCRSASWNHDERFGWHRSLCKIGPRARELDG